MTSQVVRLDDLLQIDVEAQLRKLATCQLEDDADVVLELLRTAVFAGATDLVVKSRGDRLRITAKGPIVSRDSAEAIKLVANQSSEPHARQLHIETVERNAGPGWIALLGRKDLRTRAQIPHGDQGVEILIHTPRTATPRGPRLPPPPAPTTSLLEIGGLSINRRALKQRIARRLTCFGPAIKLFGVELRPLRTPPAERPVRQHVRLDGLDQVVTGSFLLASPADGHAARVRFSHGGFLRGSFTLEQLRGVEITLDLDPLGPTPPESETLHRALHNSMLGIEEGLARAAAQWASSATPDTLPSLRALVRSALTYRKQSPLKDVEVFEYLLHGARHVTSWDRLVSSAEGGILSYVDTAVTSSILRSSAAARNLRVWVLAPEIIAVLRDEYGIQGRPFHGADHRRGLRRAVAAAVRTMARLNPLGRGQPLTREALDADERYALKQINEALDSTRANGRKVELSVHRGGHRCTSDHWLLPRHAAATRELVAAINAEASAAYLAVLSLEHDDAVPTNEAARAFSRLIADRIDAAHHSKAAPDPNRRGPSSLTPAEGSAT